MPRRRPPLSFLLLLSFLFVSLVFFSNKSENKRHTLEDFAFETSQELFSGTWRNVVAFDSKSIRERKERLANVFHLGNADDFARKRREGEEREEEEEKVSVPLLTTNRAETRSSDDDDDGNAR
jgi:hypothetical protein|tara:strand:- start:23 stop:391 length:369 start_codon:yes stop_codon:yes gene_type:complete|mmetsp:Transcript_120/g.411  ORF Transcript_120/g.411 Transcript_120/m.411 type:complete len:123 (-) Transcript_120:2-370(-)